VWIEEAAHACGMDICAMDVLRVEKTGKEFILELNCSAIGLNGRHAEEDNIHIRDLVLRRMEEAAAKSMLFFVSVILFRKATDFEADIHPT
jgi:glutathione synthase/RimK-type ligase-like ATP-grasp enzyme